MRLNQIVFAFTGLLCALFTAAASCAQTGSMLPAAEAPKTVAALTAVEQHWTQAEVHGDVAYVAALLAPKYVSVNADGIAHPRSAILASTVKNGQSDKMARFAATYMKLHPFGTSVRIQGDTGIVTFYSLKAGLQNGVLSSDIFTYLDGRWHAVYSQHTLVKA
ncbi:MAG TPA: nuclear transport factor 2 family protein [Candidatus Acidoferrum sp.]|nr:nuclear transport factor 2 family protein [Candidatus Acidoferrum sp.]